ncbi:elongator complex protein 4 isoform X2 [Prionailurus iriomotensis]
MAAVATCGTGAGSTGSMVAAGSKNNVTSFQRRGPRASGSDSSYSRLVSIAGTRPSVRNGQLLVSTGLPALDQLLGGGLAVGTVLLIEKESEDESFPIPVVGIKYFLAGPEIHHSYFLVTVTITTISKHHGQRLERARVQYSSSKVIPHSEEDKYNIYSSLLFKYFLAEGIINGHTLLVASAKEDPADILQELPAPLLDDNVKKDFDEDACNHKTAESNIKMKIAWRYQLLPKMEHSGQWKLCKFRLETIGNYRQVEPVRSSTLYRGAGPVSSSRFGHYYDASKKMPQELIEASKWHGFFFPEKSSSTLNIEPCSLTHGYIKLLQFIQNIIYEEGFDGSNPQNKAIISRVTNLSDTVVGLESFIGSERETNPLYKDYHGLIHIRQIPRLNNLIYDVSDVKDLAFKLKRKLFTIE